ncbi:MAG: hypothetical protein ACRDN9_07510 [Streptosporangiaceae bacterium]
MTDLEETQVTPGVRRRPLRRWVGQLGYGLVSFPLNLVSALLTLVGGLRTAAGWQCRLAGRTPRRASAPALLAHVLATTPAVAVAFVLSGLSTWVLGLNLAYPLRDFSWWDLTHVFSASHQVADSWGGPTLAGAWAVHGLGAIAIAVVLSWPIGWLTDLHRRSVTRRLCG